MWQNCIKIIHGSEAREEDANIMSWVQTQLKDLFHYFTSSFSILLPRHHHLFTSPLSQILQGKFDYLLSCWMRSISEAKLNQVAHVALQQETAAGLIQPTLYTVNRNILASPNPAFLPDTFSFMTEPEIESSTSMTSHYKTSNFNSNSYPSSSSFAQESVIFYST
jgi:hypothetical protein